MSAEPTPLTDEERQAIIVAYAWTENLFWCNRVEFQRHGNADGSVSCRWIDPAIVIATISALRSKLTARDADCAALREAFKSTHEVVKAWCHQISEVGTGWDNWDHYYKQMQYGGNDADAAILSKPHPGAEWLAQKQAAEARVKELEKALSQVATRDQVAREVSKHVSNITDYTHDPYSEPNHYDYAHADHMLAAFIVLTREAAQEKETQTP